MIELIDSMWYVLIRVSNSVFTHTQTTAEDLTLTQMHRTNEIINGILTPRIVSCPPGYALTVKN